MELSTIHEGATVFDANGDKLGKVHTVEADQFIVEKGFFFPTDYIVPSSVVTRVTEDEVYLSVTKDEAIDRGDAWTTSDVTTPAQPLGTPLADTTPATSGTTGTIGG